MPAIDLARLRKQAGRLAEFFFVPDEFIRHLHELLDSYVDYTARKSLAAAPNESLQAYRTPVVIVKQIEQELTALASKAENAEAALELADRLWDEAYLETRILAAFLLGRIPPQEERSLARLTAWAGQIHDPNLLGELLNRSLFRMRKEAPERFLELIGEWLHPERIQLWSNGIQAVIAALSDPEFINVPPLLRIVEPVVIAAPSKLQFEIQELILALYKAAPTETIYFVKQVLMESNNPMTSITFRRIAPSFPADLQDEVRDILRGKPLSEG